MSAKTPRKQSTKGGGNTPAATASAASTTNAPMETSAHAVAATKPAADAGASTGKTAGAADAVPSMGKREGEANAVPYTGKMEGTARQRAGRHAAAQATSAQPIAQSAPATSAQRGSGDGRIRAIIDRVIPEIDGGRFAVKRVVGDT